MGGYYINIHLKANELAMVRQALVDLFHAHGFALCGEDAVAAAVESDSDSAVALDWYGIIVSPPSGGWISVYVDDWQDSGVIVKGLSRALEIPALEVWAADEIYWGYAYYENGEVIDRFANDPRKVSSQPAEIEILAGRPEALAPILCVPVAEFAQMLDNARTSAGQFVGPAIDNLAEAVRLPFDHILIGYESFFEDDPEDYVPGLLDWPRWQHLAFKHPEGKDRLVD